MRAARFVATLVALFTWAWIGSAAADTFPAKPVRMVVPFPAGGSTDITARTLAERLKGLWAQPVIVENRAGATGIIGADAVAKAPADGHTLLLTINSFATNPALHAKLPFDPFADFVPVGMLATNSIAFAVSAAAPAKTLAEFIAAARRAQPAYAFSSFGQGSLVHVYGEVMNRQAGARLTHVPYKGEAPAITDLIGGAVAASFASPQTALQHVATGRIRVLAVADEARNPLMPEVPTFAEAGLPDLARPGWVAVYLRSGTPPAIVDRIVADVRAAISDPATVSALRQRGIIVNYAAPEALGQRMRSDLEFMTKAVRATGITLE